MWNLPPRPPARGFALLILLVVTATLAYLLLGRVTAWTLSLQREQKSLQALARAKETLIAHLATHSLAHPGLFPGYLPCPEDSGGALPEGSEAGTCGATNLSAIGRLPWRTLGLPPPTDAAAECLWYAVSGRYKRNPTAGAPLDPDGYQADGAFQIVGADGSALLAGTTAANRAVAVIFAPGAPSGSQQHTPVRADMVCPGNFTAANYLDADTSASPIINPLTGTAINNAFLSGVADGVTRFIAGPVADAPINDRLLFITKDEVYAAMLPALADLTRRAASCVAYFAERNSAYPADRRIPWAAPEGLPSYTDNCHYDDQVATYAGRLPNLVDDSASSIPSNWFVSGNCGDPKNQLLALDTPCPGWAPYIPLWQRWKSLLFYHVAPSFRPGAPVPSACGTCLQVNSAGSYAGVVLFAGRVLAGQENRNSDRDDPDEYLEGRNENNIDDSGGSQRNYETRTMSSSFNDILYCLAPDLSVAPCP